MSHSCRERLPRPDAMKPDAYQRNIAARAFDVARYLLPFGVPTGVGQVTSIRTLERQIRRLKAADYGELRDWPRRSRPRARLSRPASGARGGTEPVALLSRGMWIPTSIYVAAGQICAGGRLNICPPGAWLRWKRWICCGRPTHQPIW